MAEIYFYVTHPTVCENQKLLDNVWHNRNSLRFQKFPTKDHVSPKESAYMVIQHHYVKDTLKVFDDFKSKQQKSMK